MSTSYPATGAARERFILGSRGPRPEHDPWQHQGVIVEQELAADGRIASAATVFLTGRECPWRCAMCDLWKYTLASDTPQGAIPAQITAARRALQQQPHRVTHLKLYNAGSFFDPRAVPEGDYGAIASELAGLERVVVESHPSLVGPRVDRFLDALGGGRSGDGAARLEVAMGLETAHPGALERLHKGMTLDQFARAADALGDRGLAMRVFLLIAPPFVPPAEQDQWLLHSIDAAFSFGASVVSLVPTRPGNGTLEALAAEGLFRAPRLDDVERSVAAAQGRRPERGRIFVDLWDIERLATCPHCLEARRTRLHRINLAQRMVPPAPCGRCGYGRPS